ncbi:MAG: cbb3-type cytochrome oxidase assembly protein CcoS [Phycisphaerales bacterium]|jgi:cbb3-type cytochrome oxidase maturation protein|nr:cbb3-type cytochrome oxidase assembly protein CcoS [Phycisphaerales bacterium]
MSVLLIVLPLALILAGIGVAAFVWTVRTGQMDDLDSPALRMLFDDQKPSDTKPRE